MPLIQPASVLVSAQTDISWEHHGDAERAELSARLRCTHRDDATGQRHLVPVPFFGLRDAGSLNGSVMPIDRGEGGPLALVPASHQLHREPCRRAADQERYPSGPPAPSV